MRLPPPRRRQEASSDLPTRGRYGVCCSASTRHAPPLPRRECACHTRTPNLLAGREPARHEGMARRKAQNPMAPRSLWDHGGRLSARHMRPSEAFAHAHLRRLCGPAGPAFAMGVPPAILTPFPAPLHSALGKRLGRSDRRRLAWTPRSSASSWQGFLVSPGGGPAAARVSGLARPDPRGAAPQPAFATPRDDAPQWMRRCGVHGRPGRRG